MIFRMDIFGESNFVGGFHAEEKVAGEEMAVMIAPAMDFQIHFSAPGQPKDGFVGGKTYRAVVDFEMIAGKFEFGHRFPEIRFDAKKIIAGGSEPDTALERYVVKSAKALPPADIQVRIFSFFEADLPGGLAADRGKSIAMIIEPGAVDGLKDIDAKTIKAGGGEVGRELRNAAATISGFLEKDGIVLLGNDEDKVIKVTGLEGARNPALVNFLMLDMFGSGKFFEIFQLRLHAAHGAGNDFIHVASHIGSDRVILAVYIRRGPGTRLDAGRQRGIGCERSERCFGNCGGSLD